MTVVFPDDPLQHRTQFAFGADLTADPGTWVWTDATPALLEQQISITRGRQAESGAVTPGSISVVLDNPGGDFTPDLATGAHYPYVVEGVPMRESLRGTTTFIELPGAGARISTPTSADLQFTGDFDLRIDLTLTQWRLPGHNIGLMNKAGSGTDQSWEMCADADGRLHLAWREATDSWLDLPSTQPLVVPPSGRLAVRAAVDVDDGAGGLIAYFWTAPTLAGPWTALGDPVPVSGASALWPSTAAVEAGALTHPMLPDTVAPVGRLHGLEVRQGIGGTVRASVDAAAVDEDAAAFVQGGRTWTVTAPAGATRWVPRITAAVTEWAPSWPAGDLSDPETGDPGEAEVAVSASGILQRLGQGQPALASTLRRRIPTDRHIVAYIPFEDGPSATQAASGLPSGQAARLTGATWAADDSLAGSSPLPTLGPSSALNVPVPAPPAGSTGWRVEFVFRLDSAPAAEVPFINVRLNGGTYREVQVTTALSAFGYGLLDSTGTLVNKSAFGAPNSTGTWCRFSVSAQQNGTSTTVSFRAVVIGQPAGSATVTYTGTPGTVAGVYANYAAGTENMRIGHLGVFSVADTNIYNSADTGFAGEPAAERMIRLCAEENLPLLICGDTAATAPMGPQTPQTLLDLLQECADTDGGALTEQRDRLALKYRTLTSFYNQAPMLTLNAGAGEIANPFAPVRNDSELRNRITAQRMGGSSATVEDAASIARSGAREDQLDVNPQTDAQLPDLAGWELHLKTVQGLRYPQLTIDLELAPQLIGAWLAADSGDLIAVTDLPPQHPSDTVQTLIQGYTETYSGTSWTATTTCTPGAPYTVGVIGDDVLGRADTDGARLAAPVGPDDTTLSVAVTDGPLWTTDPAEYPVVLRLGGEDVTATGCTGASSPQNVTVVRGVNGVTRGWDAGTDIRLATPLVLALEGARTMAYPTIHAGQRVTAGLLASMLPLSVVKTVDESRASTTAMATDGALKLTVEAGATYLMEGYVSYSQNLAASSTSGIKLGWTAPAGSTLVWSSDGTDGPTSLTGQDVTSNGLAGTRNLPSNLGTAMRAAPTGQLTVGGTGGTFGLQWAQIASNATATLVRAGSWLRLIRVA
ncbi:hypothetical protein [Actinacidiphila epipremni]|uniref:Uncharacterized protein n=1 Tax=Actinacidiphila epipremni TaxID=2053013 RepID=A0ABX0ZEZ3_9ACTN|nr:hypothetical protein [Actinacidiphila epipremni]NJP42265.1 hypothetical protein [Actinacidiphila epipremni]